MMKLIIPTYDFNENTLNGEILFTILYDDLDTIQEEVY